MVQFAGFSQNHKVKIGTYKSVRPSRFELVWDAYLHGIKMYGVGSELVIGEDSTFQYTTCSTINYGKWSTLKDSLFLHIIKNRWRNDSLNKYGFKGTWPNMQSLGFKIKNNYLEQINKLKNGEKDIQKLKFNVP